MKNAFFILQAVATVSILGLVLFLAWRTRQFKKQQQKLLSQLKGKRFWRINIARPEFISSWMRISPYEASGVLIDDGDSITIQGFWQKSGQMVESNFPRSTLSVK